MPKVGSDTSKFAGARERGAFWTLDRMSELGLEGAFFRSPFELSATLDAGELREVVAHARHLGMYVQSGAAKVNPFASPEFPEIRAFGDGDYVLGLERIIRALAAAGITELWTATANYQFRIPGMYACDRFRTDVDWDVQLAATARVLGILAPTLRDAGAHLNLETHEEITSFEVVRLVEDAGPDAFGITFDSANVLVRAEDPVRAAERVAPYVRATHLRDVALCFTEDGIGRLLLPVGEGVLDWDRILPVLIAGNPDLALSIEGLAGGTRAEMSLYIDDPVWQAAHPDLSVSELAEVVRLTRGYEARAAAGEAMSLRELRAHVSAAAAEQFIVRSADALRQKIRELQPA
ncbi:MAG: sugar phosphate isomerase/epimerase [Microbacterium sp.]|uniref:sugar phosphate isomerase/epimerase family protein n=1 Tax=Microbacterium sp. TaxID=51671 RepID=UPI0039E26A55